MQAITGTNIKELKKLFSGKVRDIYEISSDKWLIVTTDRISAFDVVFNEGIPDKGLVLNRISNFWFGKMKMLPNHLISSSPENSLPYLKNYPGVAERSVIVRKVNRLPVECVVRGHLFGSVYDEYKAKGTAGGVKLPEGLRLAEQLPEPIFTPADKAETGHDENIDHSRFFGVVGQETGEKIMKYSIEIYKTARDMMKKAGIILADTKFEFGIDTDGSLILVDEVLTPDSSRYWDKDSFKLGESPKSYDKQFVRDYLNSLGWDKTPPPPPLPEDIIEKTREKYLGILNIIEKL
ncbi:MAG: phosphoribosylaminoimidazolesuccinocarboxamide synthase [Spirochaetes bacterium GWF1_51_8]|nr:MAG: phosphoribosylaminoimidazolesuccinocarboxamide synthase [Spirochaetes bacterium GWF1_51_8]